MTRKCMLLLAPVIALAGGCGVAEGAVTSRALMDHGVREGTTVPATEVECTDGSGRTVGAPGELQVLTFATPFDCTQCTPHVALGPGLIKESGLEKQAFFVVWSPNRAALRNPSLAEVDLPVCIDSGGALWDALNLLHTPFTAVVRDGAVLYLHDGNFATEQQRAQFKNDLRALAGR